MRAPSTFMLAAMALCVSRALAADPAATGYATDSSGNPVTSSAGDCWRTSQWTPGMAAACQRAADRSAGPASALPPDTSAAAPGEGTTELSAATGGGMRGTERSSASGLTDSSGNPVRNGFGQCWGTGFSASDPACAAVAGATGTAAGTTALDQSAATSATPETLAATGGGSRGTDPGSATGLTDSSGTPVRSGFGQCWGTGFSGPAPSCAAVAGTAGMAAATAGLDRSTTARPSSAAQAAPAAAAPGGFPPIRAAGNPAYLTDSNGIVVRSSQGECWRTGSWSPAQATVVGCDGVLAKAVPVPSPAPSPKPEPVAPAEPASGLQPDAQAPSEMTPPSAPTPVPPAPAPVPPAAAAPPAEPAPPAAAAPQTRPAPAPAVPSSPSPAPAEIAPPQPATPQQADAAPSDSSAQQPKAEKVTLDTDTYFDFDKATLKPEGRRKLEELASRIASMQLEVAVATGHTDWTGSDAYNQKLSERRARAVKDFLVEKGLPAGRIFTDGKGEKQPVATNKTREGRAKNRRVEVELVGTRR